MWKLSSTMHHGGGKCWNGNLTPVYKSEQQLGYFKFGGFLVPLCNRVTSEGEMLNTSAILAYSSLTLVNPWMRPVGLPWASWVWKMSLGLGYSGGSVGGGEGGESGGAVGAIHPWFWAFWSSMTLTTTALGVLRAHTLAVPHRPTFRSLTLLASRFIRKRNGPSPPLTDQTPNQPP